MSKVCFSVKRISDATVDPDVVSKRTQPCPLSSSRVSPPPADKLYFLSSNNTADVPSFTEYSVVSRPPSVDARSRPISACGPSGMNCVSVTCVSCDTDHFDCAAFGNRSNGSRRESPNRNGIGFESACRISLPVRSSVNACGWSDPNISKRPSSKSAGGMRDGSFRFGWLDRIKRPDACISKSESRAAVIAYINWPW